VWITGHRRKNCSSDAGKMMLTRLIELKPGGFHTAAWGRADRDGRCRGARWFDGFDSTRTADGICVGGKAV